MLHLLVWLAASVQLRQQLHQPGIFVAPALERLRSPR